MTTRNSAGFVKDTNAALGFLGQMRYGRTSSAAAAEKFAMTRNDFVSSHTRTNGLTCGLTQSRKLKTSSLSSCARGDKRFQKRSCSPPVDLPRRRQGVAEFSEDNYVICKMADASKVRATTGYDRAYLRSRTSRIALNAFACQTPRYSIELLDFFADLECRGYRDCRI